LFYSYGHHRDLHSFPTRRSSDLNPVLLDRYLKEAIEIDVDAICDGKDVYVAGIMEHIEEAGIHSGDSACSLPPVSIKPFLIKEIENQTKKLALALKVKGFMNIQFAIKKDEIFVLEVNPRASRTVPFVAKAVGAPIASIAAKVMAGELLSSFDLTNAKPRRIAVKEAVFPFARFPGVDPQLGPEMRSTGEVMGWGSAFGSALPPKPLGSWHYIAARGASFHLREERRQSRRGRCRAKPTRYGLLSSRNQRDGRLPV